MPKYRRWERPEKSVPMWVAARQVEPVASGRLPLDGLRCEECQEPVAQVVFVDLDGMCWRCWSSFQVVVVEDAEVLGDGFVDGGL
jgi:hypothetical protein